MTFWYYFHHHQSIDRRAVDYNSPPTGSFLGIRTMSSSEECLLVFDPFLDSAGKGLMRSVSLGSSSLGGLIHCVDVSGFILWPNSLRGRGSKGKGKGNRARDHARGGGRRPRAPKFPLLLLTPAMQASGQRT